MRLGRHQLGVQFRRQRPIGTYVVDFCCIERMMVVELDGGQHEISTHGTRRAQSGSLGMAFACCAFRIAKL
jgi:very-short-patch-repair endonuclease